MQFAKQLEEDFLRGILRVDLIVQHAETLGIDTSPISMIELGKVCGQGLSARWRRPPPRVRAGMVCGRQASTISPASTLLLPSANIDIETVVGSALIGVSSMINLASSDACLLRNSVAMGTLLNLVISSDAHNAYNPSKT